MDKTIWNDGVEVTQTQLANEHNALASNLLTRWVDGASMGVATGLEVTINGLNALQVDIAAGRGYAPGGELVELLVPQTGVALSNYGAGIDNYVCLVYRENASVPAPHETSGTTRNTKSTRTVVVRVYTLTELNALPPESLLSVDGTVDYSVDTRDRVLVCAIVNANGIAVNLVPADLTLPFTPARLLSAPLLVENVGVELRALSSTTPTTEERVVAGDVVNSQGHIRMATGATPPGTVTLEYRAPGDAGFGVAQPAVAGLVVLPSTTTTSTATVFVAVPLLPRVTGGPFTDTFDIEELYVEPVALVGAKDVSHRRTFGTKLATAANPHAVAATDVSNTAEVPWSLEIGTGLLNSLAKALTPRFRATQVGTGTSVRTLLGEFLLSSGKYARVYLVDGIDSGYDLTVNANWTGAGVWDKDVAGAEATKLTLAGQQFSHWGRAAGAGTWIDTSGWSARSILAVPYSTGSFFGGLVRLDGTTQLGAGLLTTSGGRSIPRIYTEYESPGGGGLIRSLLFEQRLTGFVDEKIIRIYRANNTSTLLNNDVLEITFNAIWSTGGSTWSKDSAASSAAKIELHRNNIVFLQRLTASGSPWADTLVDWDSGQFNFNLTTGAMTTNGAVTAGGAIAAGGNLTAGGALSVTGGATIGSTLQVPAAAVVASNFLLNVVTTFTRAILPAQTGIAPNATGATVTDAAYLKLLGLQVVAVYYGFPSVPTGGTLTSMRAVTAFAGADWEIEAFRKNNDGTGTVSMTGGPVGIGPGSVTTTVPITANNIVNHALYTYWIRVYSPTATDTGFIYHLDYSWTQISLAT